MNYTQNKIDRFTGGVINSALFTQENLYGGETKLTLLIKDENGIWEKAKDLILLAILDIGLGFAPVGGAKAVGRGILSLKEVYCDGIRFDLEDLLDKKFKFGLRRSVNG